MKYLSILNLSMMRKVSILLLMPFLALGQSETPKDHMGVPGPVKFNDTTFYLAWDQQPNPNYFVQEYLLEGETTENFTQMITVNVFLTRSTLQQAVKQKLDELEERKKTDPGCRSSMLTSPSGTEYIVDFLLSESENDTVTIAEFNVYRYFKLELKKKGPAIVVFCFTARGYKDDARIFMEELKENRPKWLNEMINSNMPFIKLK